MGLVEAHLSLRDFSEFTSLWVWVSLITVVTYFVLVLQNCQFQGLTAVNSYNPYNYPAVRD
jgi:hypothetical protein